MIFDLLIVNLLKIFLTISTLFIHNDLSIGVTGYPRSFLPHNVTKDSEKMVADLVFRKLFKYEEGELKNDLVDSWSSNETDTEYKINIKQGQKWQDGKEITADDVLYTLTLYENLINDIETEKLGQYEILIRLPNSNAILPSLLNIGVEPAHLKNRNSAESPIGSTSFRVARVFREQNKIEAVELISFADNKQYNKLNLRFYQTENQVFIGYKLGEIDLFLSDSDLVYEGLEKSNLTFIGRYYTILLNTQSNSMKNPEIRKKLLESLDTGSLLKRSYFANAQLVQGPISQSEYTKENFKFPFYNPNVKLTDLQKAEIEKIDVLLPNTQDGAQLQSFLNEYWKEKLGIPVNFEYEEVSEIYNNLGDKTSYDAVFLGFEVSPDPDRYAFWHSTQIGNLNLSQFNDLRTDKALEEGRKSFNYTDRREHYDIFQDAFLSKTPAIFLYHPGKYLYKSSRVNVSLPSVIYYPSDIVKNL